ncbi:thioesterase [Lactobacillaceae bacterium L1_55_11]|nr:thioesterase [Lactobacillaceae bacterium L1_55_11]
MATVFEMQHTVEYYEVDLNGRLTLPTIVNLAVLASKKQGDFLGIGPNEHQAMGLGWIILQYDLKIKRRPVANEEITIQTSAGEANPFFVRRWFKILDEQGNELVHIDSIWAMIDVHKRHMVRLPADQVKKYDAIPTKQVPRIPAPAKIGPDEKFKELPYRVRYLDIDANQHVNNSKYFTWMMDVLGPEFLKHHEVTHIDLKFENEVALGHVIESQVVVDGEHSRHRIMNGDVVSAEAEFDWRSI